MSKHTPGPWKIAGHGNSAGVLEISAPDLPALCGVIRGSLADARLIAAAPDLLEALRMLRAIGAGGVIERIETGKPTWNALDEVEKIARTALDKAGAL